MSIALSQATFLTDTIKGHEYVKEHFKLEDVWDIVKNLSEKQYRFILALIYQKKHHKLREVLSSVGFKNKE